MGCDRFLFSSELDKTLPKLYFQKFPSQGMNSNEITGEEIDEMKWLRKKRICTRWKTIKWDGMT